MKSVILIILLGILYIIWGQAMNKLENEAEHKRNSS